MKRTFTEQIENIFSADVSGDVSAKKNTRNKRTDGAAGWLTAPQIGKYVSDWLKQVHTTPIGVARPRSVDELSQVVRLCSEHRVPVVPQGGNTGLVLGSVPAEHQNNGIILSLERLNAIEPIDTLGCTVTVQAGVVLEQLQNVLREENLTLPLQLGSGGTAQIGGLISTNAGGSHAHRDGMMADQVLGLEVVLPDGTLWRGNRALIKDNAGYALKRLFCGAEGTLGIITSATLRLQPIPKHTSTLLLSCATLHDALAALRLAQSLAGSLLSAAEFMHHNGLEILQRQCPHIQSPLPITRGYTLLLEFTSTAELIDLPAIVEHFVEQALERRHASDGVIATNETQRRALWQLREDIPEGQRLHGPQLKHDVSVPLASLAAFIEAATVACQAVQKSVIVNPFGHLADGNVHFNLSAPEDDEDEFLASRARFNAAVYKAVTTCQGSIAAEHGLGRSKVSLADQSRPALERLLMKRIKHAIDPHSIMNRGVIIAESDEVPERRDEKGTT